MHACMRVTGVPMYNSFEFEEKVNEGGNSSVALLQTFSSPDDVQVKLAFKCLNVYENEPQLDNYPCLTELVLLDS